MIDIGSVISGKYRLLRILGDGGMGSVYEAEHVGLGTRVAIKLLHPELARRSGLVERFLQEARVAAQIRSAHVVQVTDVDRTSDGQAYIVMELLEGEPLSSVLERQRRLPVPVAGGYTIQVLEALEAAHALGVIHRDLKPENVFLTFHGGRPVIKLIDFGIAKARRLDSDQKGLTIAGIVMGTAEYMAPEQARSADQVDARSDLYAVGVMLFEMIAGVRPVSGDDARVIALKVERGEVTPLVQAAPETPGEIAGLVHRAMAARPELRFATATEMRLALEAALNRKGSTAQMGASPHAASPEDRHSEGPATAHPHASAQGAHNASVHGTHNAAAPGAHRASVHGAHNAAAPQVRTVRAPPIATALAPPPVYAPVPAFNPGARKGGPARRRPMPVWLAVGLLLLGAGALGAIGVAVLPGILAPPAAPSPVAVEVPSPAPAASASTQSPQARPTSPTPSAARTSDVPSLAPTALGPVRPSSSARPPSHPAADAGVLIGPPPLVFPPAIPSSLPSFPSAFPSGLPFPAGLPSAFALPSGFPSTFPGFPAPVAVTPPASASSSPPPAASASATSY